MTHPISLQEFQSKLMTLISENPIISTNQNLIDKLKDLKHIEETYPSNPKRLGGNGIKDVGEKALQRGILFGKSTLLDYGSLKPSESVNWIDIEVPVVLSNNGRRPSIDMIGLSKDKLILSEIKYNNKKDSPIYAVFELLIYYYFIRYNYEKLDKENVFHKSEITKNFKWENYLKNSVPLLLVTANTSYWQYWFNNKINRVDLLKEILIIENKLQIEIQLFITEDENFSEQKGNNDTYTPKLKSNIWTKICS